jgi:hypothetical protein
LPQQSYALSIKNERCEIIDPIRAKLLLDRTSEWMMGEFQAWQLVVAGASVIIAIAGLHISAVKWLLGLRDAYSVANANRLAELEHKSGERMGQVERDVLRLRADLPLEYVRREDWIRFGNTLEVKIDAIRAEMREQLAQLRHERLLAARDNSP